MSRSKLTALAGALVLLLAFLAAGCGGSSKKSAATTTGTTAATTTVAMNSTIAAEVPAKIKSKGPLPSQPTLLMRRTSSSAPTATPSRA